MQLDKTKNQTFIIRLLPYIVIFACFLVLVNNSYYGFGWTDEALYLATVNTLYSGNRLFFDIWEPTQFYSPILFPFFSFFVESTGKTDSIYLFFRILTLVIQLIASVYIFNVLSKKYKKNLVLVSVLGLLSFARASLPGPSYYTICLYSFASALVILFAVFVLKWKKYHLFFAGILFSIAVLCNPYLVFIYSFTTILVLINKKIRKKIKDFSLVYLGIIFSASIYLFFALRFESFSSFLKSLPYLLSSPEYSGKTTLQTIKWLLKFPRIFITPIFYYFPFTIVSVLCFFKKDFREKIILKEPTVKKLLILLLFINYLVFVFIKNDCGAAITGFFYIPFFIVSIFSKFSKKDFKNFILENKTLFYTFIMPGLSLSLAQCLCSDTGFGVFSIGIVICFFGAVQLFDCAIQKSDLPFKPIFYKLFLILTVVLTLFFRINLTYRDKKLRPHFLFIPTIHSEIVKIEYGPAKGLWTSKDNYTQYESIFKVIKNIKTTEGDSFLILKLCPWAYLVNKELSPFAMTAWRISLSDARLKMYFEETFHPFPTHILVLNENIRDNNGNFFDESSYLLQKLIELDYSSQKVECGVLYTKKDIPY